MQRDSGQIASGGVAAQNQAAGQTAAAYQNLGKSIANPNYGTDETAAALGDVSGILGKGGNAQQLGSAGKTLYDSLLGPSSVGPSDTTTNLAGTPTASQVGSFFANPATMAPGSNLQMSGQW